MPRKLTDHQLDEIAEQSERDLDRITDEIDRGETPKVHVRRGPGRPRLGSEASETLRVRIEPELRQALNERAEAEHTNTSDVVRRALREYLRAG